MLKKAGQALASTDLLLVWPPLRTYIKQRLLAGLVTGNNGGLCVPGCASLACAAILPVWMCGIEGSVSPSAASTINREGEKRFACHCASQLVKQKQLWRNCWLEDTYGRLARFNSRFGW